MLVTAFLRYRVELVEKENAPARSDSGEHLGEPRCGLAKVARNDLFVPDDEEGEHQCLGNSLRDGRLAVPRRPCKKQSMTRLKAMRPKYLDTRLLLDQLVDGRANVRTENEIVELLARRHERDAAGPLLGQGWGLRARSVRSESLLQAFRQEVMLLLPLLSDQRFGGPAKRYLIPGASRADKSDKQVSTGHALSLTGSAAGCLRGRQSGFEPSF
jgi:hypothetical protein